MANFLVGIFIILHGLVHLWYVVLSQKLVEFRPEMGWTGVSWIFTNLLGDSITRLLASVFYSMAAIAMIASGIGIISRGGWSRSLLIGSALLSSATIILFWDGSVQRVVEKGLVGLLISVAILVVVMLSR